jgi:hypothetical protein
MPKKAMQKTAGTGARGGEFAKGKGAKAKPSAGGMEAGRPAGIAVSGETTATATLTAPTHEQVARRAREIWEQRGCPPGQDEQIWLEAEMQLKREAERS